PVVVLDPKGELHRVTARRRRQMGHRVVKLDPFHCLGPDSDGLNPFDVLELAGADLETDAQMIADWLSLGNKGMKDPFWDLSAGGLLAGLLIHAGCQPHADRCLSTARKLILGDDPVYKMAVLLDTVGKTMNRMAYDEIAAFLQMSERETRPSVLSTAISYLKPLVSTRVARTLDQSTFELSDVHDGRPLSIYIVLPPDKISSHKAILKMFLGTLLKAVTTRTRAPAQRTLFLLDECGQMGAFPFLETVMTLCAGYGVQCWTFWQDLDQLSAAYPTTWRTILNNCGVLQAFGIVNKQMATQWASYLDAPADELLTLAADEQVVFIEGRGEQRCRRLDYLRDKRFAGLFDPNPLHEPAPGHEAADRDDAVDEDRVDEETVLDDEFDLVADESEDGLEPPPAPRGR
ncbi:MAG: type IV secretory system conjugative DNA transfer family protein, partial [Planctomycetia bacterium]